MKYKEIKPNITQHFFTFDSTEDKEMYWKCNWARINLDHDNYILSATSDCGDYTYQWCVTPSESFLKLMCRIGSDYLLGKISSEVILCAKIHRKCIKRIKTNE